MAGTAQINRDAVSGITSRLPLVLMNSFYTRDDSIAADAVAASPASPSSPSAGTLAGATGSTARRWHSVFAAFLSWF